MPKQSDWNELLGTYGHSRIQFGHLWALHSGRSWLLVVTRGHSKALETIALSTKSLRAGDGNRTRMASLEGWSSTIELHPHVSHETRKSLDTLLTWSGGSDVL
jgi:hypothetical protein